METQHTTYTGGCHCDAVRFTVESEPITSALECNCSHCEKKGVLLAFIPKSQFTLTQGEEKLTEYRFNSGMIQHLFCSLCGTEAFSYGKGETGETVALNVRCIDDFDINDIERTAYNGKDA